MRLAPLALAIGCAAPATEATIEVASVSLDLYTPADVDPLAGADRLVARVFDRRGQVVAEAEGGLEGLSVPELDTFGVIEIEISARAGDTVLSAGRTGWISLGEGDARERPLLFLPVNQAVELDFTPQEERLEHITWPTPDGRVLLLGGRRPSSSISHDSTEWLDPFEGFVGEGPDLPAGTYGMAAAAFGDREQLVAGGRYAQTPEDARAAEVFWLGVDGSVQTLPAMSYARDAHCLGNFQQTAVIAIGGRGVDGDRTLEVLRQNATGEFAWNLILMDSLITSDVSGCVGTGSGFLVTTGHTEGAWGVLDLRTAANSDIPASFDAMADPPGPLEGAMLVPLAEDVVLVLGGYDGGDALTDGNLVYATQAILGDTVGLGTARAWGQWRWWREGEVLAVAGGYRDGARSSAVQTVELVDLEQGPLLEVDVPLKHMRLDVLPGGAMLFTGGVEDGGASASAWAVVPWL